MEKYTVKDAIVSAQYQDLERIAAKPYFSDIKSKHFLITGGNGFVAYHIVLPLLILNDLFGNENIITILVRSESGARKRYGNLLQRNDINLLIQDVCEPIENAQAFDYVIHAASAADASHFDSDPIGVFNSNVIGTENIINFLKQKNCISAVYVSSFTVYGQVSDNIATITEDVYGSEPWNTIRACYSYGKRAGEFLCTAAHCKLNLPIKIVRPGFVYGASPQTDTRVYAEVIHCVASKKNIVMKSAGHLYRSMIYITDLVDGIYSVLFNGQNGEAYNIAAEHISIRQFAEAAITVASDSNVDLLFENEEDRYALPTYIGPAMDISKIAQDCGWKPATNINDGVAWSVKVFAGMNRLS